MMEARFGKMPTTSVRLRISRLSRSCGLLLQICRQCSLGKLVNGEHLRRLGESRLELLDDASFGTFVSRFRMKCVRHRCQLAPRSTEAIASLSPGCASEITNST